MNPRAIVRIDAFIAGCAAARMPSIIGGCSDSSRFEGFAWPF